MASSERNAAQQNGAGARDMAAATQQQPHPTQTLRRIAELVDRGLVAAGDSRALNLVAERFSVAVTPAMAALIDPHDPHDPIALQFIPDARELEIDRHDVSDPIGDAAHTPVKGIVHRYPDRLLLLPLKVCSVYCRFCFRRETVGTTAADTLSDAELDAALAYIRAHQEVWEVILSGGDPLLLSPRRLGRILAALATIEHVQVIRIHTRVPVVDPARINAELLGALRGQQAVYVVLHTNHPRELTPAALAACTTLADAGVPLLSQSVLLKGVNDDAATLEQLFRTLVANRIKPYYLHHADRAPGTAHFRTSVARGRARMRELRGRLSGVCLPEYVLDIPGGHGKTPLNSDWLTATADGYVVTDYRGDLHHYTDEPAVSSGGASSAAQATSASASAERK